MTAIVLVGGMGTRLKSVISDLPKPMAPLNDKPFLFYTLSHLVSENVSKIILSTGYLSSIIENYFGAHFLGIPIVYSVEDHPLGTGGAIKKALSYVEEEEVCVLNGDTYFEIDYQKLHEALFKSDADGVIALKEVKESSRYGTVEITKEGKIVSFCEKQYQDLAIINAGVYLIKKSLFAKNMEQENFSFETFLSTQTDKLTLFGCIFYEEFIDIGIPEDYQKAKELFLRRGVR